MSQRRQVSSPVTSLPVWLLSDASCPPPRLDVNQCVLVTEIGAERDDLALSTMTSNILRLLKLPLHG